MMFDSVIYGVNWKVIFTDDYHDFHTNETLFGVTVYDTHTIYIRESLCDEAKKRTLIHEITHALMCCQGRVLDTGFDKEQLCEFVAWNADYIVRIANDLFKKYQKEKKEDNQ